MPNSNEICLLISKIHRALIFLKAERRDEKREYDNAIRKLEVAQNQLVAGMDQPELVQVDTVLEPALASLIENPTLK